VREKTGREIIEPVNGKRAEKLEHIGSSSVQGLTTILSFICLESTEETVELQCSSRS